MRRHASAPVGSRGTSGRRIAVRRRLHRTTHQRGHQRSVDINKSTLPPEGLVVRARYGNLPGLRVAIRIAASTMPLPAGFARSDFAGVAVAGLPVEDDRGQVIRGARWISPAAWPTVERLLGVLRCRYEILLDLRREAA